MKDFSNHRCIDKMLFLKRQHSIIYFISVNRFLSLRLEGEENQNAVVPVGPHAETVNIVSNDQGRTQKCNIFLDQKYPLWANLV